jgi:hypothetical protein
MKIRIDGIEAMLLDYAAKVRDLERLESKWPSPRNARHHDDKVRHAEAQVTAAREAIVAEFRKANGDDP